MQYIAFVFFIGMGYLMLFNSRTENTDYMMISPALGYFLSLFIFERKWFGVVIMNVSILLLCINLHGLL